MNLIGGAQDEVRVKRAFVDTPLGQIHYRTAGPEDAAGGPVVMIHASPGSSAQLVPLIERIAQTHRVIAPDTPGFGDSNPQAMEAPTAADFAATLADTLDALRIDTFYLYGSHTGACIAAELAILIPDRVKRLILDGVGLFEGQFKADLLAHYAPSFAPEQDGAYLIRAFQFCRDQSLFWPWFDKRRESRRDCGLMPTQRLHEWVLEVLKAPETYRLGYRAAYSWTVKDRLPLIAPRTLMISALDDPLAADTQALAPLLPHGAFRALPHSGEAHFVETRASCIVDYFSVQAE